MGISRAHTRILLSYGPILPRITALWGCRTFTSSSWIDASPSLTHSTTEAHLHCLCHLVHHLSFCRVCTESPSEWFPSHKSTTCSVDSKHTLAEGQNLACRSDLSYGTYAFLPSGFYYRWSPCVLSWSSTASPPSRFQELCTTDPRTLSQSHNILAPPAKFRKWTSRDFSTRSKPPKWQTSPLHQFQAWLPSWLSSWVWPPAKGRNPYRLGEARRGITRGWERWQVWRFAWVGGKFR